MKTTDILVCKYFFSKFIALKQISISTAYVEKSKLFNVLYLRLMCSFVNQFPINKWMTREE